MCECGCISNHNRYTFPAPNDGIYVLTLAGPCTNCVAPAGVMIELIEKGNVLYREYKQGDFSQGPLVFDQWPDSKGVSIVTGPLREEFVRDGSGHLVGIGKEMFGDDGKIDAASAEVILEEMYDDVMVQPKLLTNDVKP